MGSVRSVASVAIHSGHRDGRAFLVTGTSLSGNAGWTFFLPPPVRQPTAHCLVLSLLQPYTSEIALLPFPSPSTLFPEAPQPLCTREPTHRHLLEQQDRARTLSL